MSSEIHSPIVIFGTGRCGSTLLHDLVATHKNVAWLSRLNDIFYSRPAVASALMKAIDLPMIGGRIRYRFPPAEPYGFYDHFHAGISESCRDLTRSDIHPATVRKLRNALGEALTPRRNRLLVKFTGWSRLGLVSEVLPGANFIHVVRDPRAVAYSMMRVPFWKGWSGPSGWRYGPLTERHQELWDKSRQSFAVLAAIEWDIVMEAAEIAAEKLEIPPLEVRYESLCEDPLGVTAKVLEFCGLDGTGESLASPFAIQSTNAAWRDALDPDDILLIDEYLKPRMTRYGYLQR